MTVMAKPSPTSCEIGGRVWDLRYGAIALRALQLRLGSLEQLASKLMEQRTDAGMGQSLSLETQALLIWAGQKAAEPKIKLKTVKRLLYQMHPTARALLVTWACADFTRAVLELLEAQLKLQEPQEDEDGDEP